jgi:hypothetical protein
VEAPNSVSIAIVQASVFFLIEPSLNVLPLFFGLWSFGDPFKWCLAAAAELSLVCGLQNDAFTRADGGTKWLESITFFPTEQINSFLNDRGPLHSNDPSTSACRAWST